MDERDNAKAEHQQAQADLHTAFDSMNVALVALATAHVEHEQAHGELPPLPWDADYGDPKLAKVVEAHRQLREAERARDHAKARIQEARRCLRTDQGSLPKR